MASLFLAGSLMLDFISWLQLLKWLKYSRWRPTTILYYCFVDNFVKSQYKKLKICWFVSCKVVHVGLYFQKCSFSNDWNIQDGVWTTILDYYFVNNFVKSHNKKLKLCWFVSCKVFHVGLYFQICSIWSDWNVQDGVRTAILEYCFVKHFLKTAHNILKICSSVPFKVFRCILKFHYSSVWK